MSNRSLITACFVATVLIEVAGPLLQAQEETGTEKPKEKGFVSIFD